MPPFAALYESPCFFSHSGVGHVTCSAIVVEADYILLLSAVACYDRVAKLLGKPGEPGQVKEF